MDLMNWAIQISNWASENANLAIHNVNSNGWGVTPLSLSAPLALITLIMMARRISRAAGPKQDTRDVGGALMITVIIGAAFVWIFLGLTIVIPRIAH